MLMMKKILLFVGHTGLYVTINNIFRALIVTCYSMSLRTAKMEVLKVKTIVTHLDLT